MSAILEVNVMNMTARMELLRKDKFYRPSCAEDK